MEMVAKITTYTQTIVYIQNIKLWIEVLALGFYFMINKVIDEMYNIYEETIVERHNRTVYCFFPFVFYPNTFIFPGSFFH